MQMQFINRSLNQVQLLAGDTRTVHMTSSYMISSQFTKTFTPINLDRIEFEPGARCHCVSCHDAAADMLHELPRPFIRSGHLTKPQANFSK